MKLFRLEEKKQTKEKKKTIYNYRIVREEKNTITRACASLYVHI